MVIDFWLTFYNTHFMSVKFPVLAMIKIILCFPGRSWWTSTNRFVLKNRFIVKYFFKLLRNTNILLFFSSTNINIFNYWKISFLGEKIKSRHKRKVWKLKSRDLLTILKLMTQANLFEYWISFYCLAFK